MGLAKLVSFLTTNQQITCVCSKSTCGVKTLSVRLCTIDPACLENVCFCLISVFDRNIAMILQVKNLNLTTSLQVRLEDKQELKALCRKVVKDVFCLRLYIFSLSSERNWSTARFFAFHICSGEWIICHPCCTVADPATKFVQPCALYVVRSPNTVLFSPIANLMCHCDAHELVFFFI